MITYPEELEKMKKSTPARIGIGHTGARYTTTSALTFWADQSKAADAVFSEVPQSVVLDLGALEVRTKCKNKYEMLTRPEMSESDYTVVSNISCYGIPPVEAAAHIVDLIEEILQKKSGVALKN